MKVKNKIGFSLPLTYCSGKFSAEYNAALGSIDDCLTLLSSVGVDSIELRSMNQASSVTDTQRAIETIQRYGMSITIHGSLPAPGFDGKLEEALPAIQAIPEEMEMIITVHSYAGKECSTERYTEQTINALKSMLANTDRKFKIALELTRANAKNDPGTTYSGILDMIEALNSPNLGICWDYGHTASNISNGLLAALPPGQFLDKVIHTHIHDLFNDNTTHFPLTCAKIPLHKFNAALLKTGYSGCANIELNPERWTGPSAEKRQAVLSSIQILKKSLLSCNSS